MMKITIIAPYPKMVQDAIGVCRMYGERVEVIQGIMQEGVRAAQRAVETGAAVLISRGGTYLRIREAVPVPCVQIAVTPSDMMRALLRAQGKGTTFGVVGFINVISGLGEWGSLLRVPVVPIEIQDDDQHARSQIRRAIREQGVDCLLGDTSVERLSRELGLPYVLIESGKESIWEAVQQAKHIFTARMTEREAHAPLRTAFDRVPQGLLLIQNGLVQFANRTVLQLIGRDSCSGMPVSRCLPERLSEWLQTASEERNPDVIQVGSRIFLAERHILADSDLHLVSLSPVDQIERMEQRVRQKRADSGHRARYTFDDLYGHSPAIRFLKARALDFAGSEATVLITGETGTGKEMLAQAIHNAGRRAEGPFVAVNCAALPEQLLESELFGYEEGAFTGARRGGKPGLFELAHGGTLFLDEVGEMPPVLQQRLLRVLQERTVMRLGGERIIPVDVRILAATNQPLWRLIQEGRFRKDLYFRLDVLRLNTVPLRERPEDLPELTKGLLYHVWLQNKGVGTPPTIDPAVFPLLQTYPWPGNVRELRNMVEYVLATRDNGWIDVEAVREWFAQKALPGEMPHEDAPGRPAGHLDNRAENGSAKKGGSVTEASPGWRYPSTRRLGEPGVSPGPEWTMEAIERWAIERALTMTGGDMTRAALQLGISRTTLWRKLKQWQQEPL